MSTDRRCGQDQISKIIQSGGSCGFSLGNSSKALTYAAIFFRWDNLPGFVINLVQKLNLK